MDQRPAICARIPAKVGCRGKGEVSDTVGGKPPGELPLPCRAAPGRAGLVRRDDSDRSGGTTRDGKSALLRGRQDSRRVLQGTRGRYHVASGQGETHVEAAVLQVELAGADVGLV